jgi:hypothetical protein
VGEGRVGAPAAARHAAAIAHSLVSIFLTHERAASAAHGELAAARHARGVRT